jgi:hypothetical protein
MLRFLAMRFPLPTTTHQTAKENLDRSEKGNRKKNSTNAEFERNRPLEKKQVGKKCENGKEKRKRNGDRVRRQSKRNASLLSGFSDFFPFSRL